MATPKKLKESTAPAAVGSVPGNNGETLAKYVELATGYGEQDGKAKLAKLNMCLDIRNGVVAEEITAETLDSICNAMAFAYLRKQAEKSNGRKVPENQNIFVAKLKSFGYPQVIERIQSYDALRKYIATTSDELATTDTFECCVRLNTGITKVMTSKDFKAGKVTLPDYSETYMKSRVAKTATTPATPAATATTETDPVKIAEAATTLAKSKAIAARRSLKAAAVALKDSGFELTEKETKMIAKILERYEAI